MGHTYKKISILQVVVDKVFCDNCDKEIPSPIDYDSDTNWSNYFEFSYGWGWGSRKDGETHKAVICESCYDEIFKNVKIQVFNFCSPFKKRDNAWITQEIKR